MPQKGGTATVNSIFAVGSKLVAGQVANCLQCTAISQLQVDFAAPQVWLIPSKKSC